jgi:hypothetical protein
MKENLKAFNGTFLEKIEISWRYNAKMVNHLTD